MNSLNTDNAIADEIREVYRTDSGDPESAVRNRVNEYCTHMTVAEKRDFLNRLMGRFEGRQTPVETQGTGEALPKDLLSLLLGKSVAESPGTSQETLEKLSMALDTLFSTLNRIVKTIDTALATQDTGDQTIRGLIGSQIDEELGGQTIEAYLGKIEKAFLTSHQAFRQAAHTIFSRILTELDPGAIADASEGRLKFGPMKKAEQYDIYETKYTTIRGWFESGRFMKDFLREFENNCQTSL